MPATFESWTHGRGERFYAIALMALTVVCFTGLDSCAKLLSPHLPALEIAWARYMAAAVVAAGATRVYARPRILLSHRPGLQALRSGLLLGSTICNFVALRRLQLAETSTIAFLSPIFIAALAGPLLGEWPGRARVIAIGLSFAGVVAATRPGTAGFDPLVIVSVMGALCGAGYSLATRGLAGRDSGQTTLLWTQAAGVMALTPLLPWVWVSPGDGWGWGLMFLMGAFGALGHALLIKAHKLAPASVLAPFAYTQLVWMILSGLILFGDRPPASTLLGAALVVGCGLFLLGRERGGDAK